MADVSPEVRALATKLAQEMAPRMAERLAKATVKENVMRILYTQKNSTSTLKHQVEGISAELGDVGYQLDQVQTLLVAIVLHLNAMADKLGVPSEIQLPGEAADSDDPDDPERPA